MASLIKERWSGSKSRVRQMVGTGRTPIDSVLLPVLGIMTFFGLWSFVSWSGLVSAQLLPTPLEVFEEFVSLLLKPFAGSTLLTHLLSSIGRFALSFLLAVSIGIPLGLMMGWYGWLDDAVSPVFEAVRFIPPLAWVPFAALWFGTGIGGPILIIFAGAFPPCLINAYRGAKAVDGRLVEAAKMMGAGGWRIILEVLLPGALPSIVAGLRVGAGLGWMSLVGAELIVVSSGVGYLMVQGQSNLAPSIVMSGMIAIGVVGFAIDASLRFLERKVSSEWGVTTS